MDATRQTMRLTAEAALRAVEAAVAQAGHLGACVNACVVDAGGNTIAFLRGSRTPAAG